MTEQALAQINNTAMFLKEALCVDGIVKFVRLTDPTPGFNTSGMLFQLEDSKRGLFFVGIYKECDGDQLPNAVA